MLQRLLFTQMTKHCNVQWFPSYIHNREQHNSVKLPQIYITSVSKGYAVYLVLTAIKICIQVWALCKEIEDQYAHAVTQVATAVFYYPGEWGCSVRLWLLALTFFCRWWLRVQVSHYLFLLIVYCVLMRDSSWVDRKQEPNDTGKNPASVGTSQELTQSPCSWWHTLACAMMIQTNLMILHPPGYPGNVT